MAAESILSEALTPGSPPSTRGGPSTDTPATSPESNRPTKKQKTAHIADQKSSPAPKSKKSKILSISRRVSTRALAAEIHSLQRRSTRSGGGSTLFKPSNAVKNIPGMKSLTEWQDWMYDMGDKSKKTLKKIKEDVDIGKTYAFEAAERERKRIENEEKRKREAEEKKRLEEIEREKERQAREAEREARAEEKRKRKEELLELKRIRREERDKLRLTQPWRKTEDDISDDDDDELLKQRTSKPKSMLVDGYLPFLPGWREDVEIPIRENFFVDEVIEMTNSQVTNLSFTRAAEVIEYTIHDRAMRYREYKDLERQNLLFPTPVFPQVQDDYLLMESQDFYLDPLEEIGRLMEMFSFCYIPEEHKLKVYDPNAPYQSMVGRYSKAFYSKDYTEVLKIIDEFKELMENIHQSGELIKHLKEKKTFSRMAIHELLNQIYSRAVSPKVSTLKSYKAFSNEVYGELLPKFISMIFDQCGVKSSHKFMDLGSGVGNVTIQAAVEYGCESYGVEIMPNCSLLADKQEVMFRERAKLFGIRPGAVKLFGNQSFVGNPPVLDIINQCDIILVNNFLFTPDLNKQTLQLFLDLKVGTKIISLKKVIPEARYHDFDDDFLSRFLVERHAFGAGCVSWTDAGGVYYITTFTGQVSEERKRQLQKTHNTRHKESEFLKRSASANLSSTSSTSSVSPPPSDVPDSTPQEPRKKSRMDPVAELKENTTVGETCHEERGTLSVTAGTTRTESNGDTVITDADTKFDSASTPAATSTQLPRPNGATKAFHDVKAEVSGDSSPVDQIIAEQTSRRSTDKSAAGPSESSKKTASEPLTNGEPTRNGKKVTPQKKAKAKKTLAKRTSFKRLPAKKTTYKKTSLRKSSGNAPEGTRSLKSTSCERATELQKKTPLKRDQTESKPLKTSPRLRVKAQIEEEAAGSEKSGSLPFESTAAGDDQGSDKENMKQSSQPVTVQAD